MDKTNLIIRILELNEKYGARMEDVKLWFDEIEILETLRSEFQEMIQMGGHDNSNWKNERDFRKATEYLSYIERLI